MTLALSTKSIITSARTSLHEMSAINRFFHVFWLLGPFVLLIERSPADLWLTILGLAFVVRSIITRDGEWLRVFWVRASFAFWGVCIVTSALSTNPIFSLTEAFIWFRFPLLAFATVFWLGKDKRVIYAMLLSMAVGLLVMCSILTAEIIIEGQKGGRLVWPYGDPLPGSYIAKFGLPVFVVMVALAVGVTGPLAAVSAILALATLVVSILTGERINFLIRACGGMLAGMVWRPIWSRYISLVIVEVLAVVIVFQAAPSVGNRYVDTFITQLPTQQESPYRKAMDPGFELFQNNPLTGVGVGSFQRHCNKLATPDYTLSCHPHPHNYYIQMLAETGVFGLIFGVIFIGAMIWSCFAHGWRYRANVVTATAWVVPFGLFWPIASTADFFGQWNNIFLWTALAVALASVNIKDDDRL